MTVATIAKPSTAGMTDDERDVADLWKVALKNYKGIVGFDLEKTFDNTQSMIDQGVKEMNAFHKFRHNDKKVDKLRSLFAANIDFIEKGANQLIAAATPAFPPAAAIGTAMTFMLKACRQVSADYDIVVVFFEDMNSFLQRIVILETRMPRYKAYQNCLMDVFTSFLTMCGLAHKFIELGRFKKWIQNLMFGQDSELGGARKDMDKKLDNLQNATETAILGNTEELKKMNDELRQNQDAHTELLEQQKQVLGSIQDTTERISSDVAKLIQAFEEHKKERGQSTAPKAKAAVNSCKSPSAKRVRAIFPEIESDLHEYHFLKETLVKDTGAWMFAEPVWDKWLKQEDTPRMPLAITGPPGTGKSHLAAHVYEQLVKVAAEDSSKQTCVTHFYIREQHRDLSYLNAAIISTLNQAAEQNLSVCETILGVWSKMEIPINLRMWEDSVKHFMGVAFHKSSKNRLFMVLDGIDELRFPDAFPEFLTLIKELELRITVVFTSRPEIIKDISEASPLLRLEVSREKQLEDLKTLLWSRLNSLEPMRKFSRYVKQRVADKLESESPNLLYAEHMLNRLNSLDREGAILRNLSKPMPPSLHQLYEDLWESCYRRTASEHQELIKTLLHLVAFAVRPLSLDEIVSLLKAMTGDKDFDVDDVPEPFAHFIRVGDLGADAEARENIDSLGGARKDIAELEKSDSATASDKIYDDSSLPVKFRERSMKTFFCNPPEHQDSLRWTPSEAHRQLFLITAKLVRTFAPSDTERLGEKVQQYAMYSIFYHWRHINPEEHSVEEKVEVMEESWAILTNKYGFASLLSQEPGRYANQFNEDAVKQISKWARLVSSDGDVRSRLGDNVATWWSGLVEKPRDCLLSIAKAHLLNIYQSSSLEEINSSFQGLREALSVGKFDALLSEQAAKNFPSAAKDVAEGSDTIAVLGIPGLFGMTTMNGAAYRSVAELLLNHEQEQPAEEMCVKALELCKDPMEEFNSLLLMAQIQLAGERTAEAYDYVGRAMTYFGRIDVPSKLKQEVITCKARIEAKKGDAKAALKSYEEAKAADTSRPTTGDILDEELHLFVEDREQYMAIFRSWTPLERLSWMGWKYDDWISDRHILLRDMAAETGQMDFAIKSYGDSIQYLDNVNSGAPLRLELALLYIESCGDFENGRKVLDQVLDSSSEGWPYAVTEQYPDETLDRTIKLQSDVLFSLFRRSKDPSVKQELFEAAKNLMTRQLALDVPPRSEWEVQTHRLVVAQMCRKMGSAVDFQKRMMAIVDSCLDGLSDTAGWNDSAHLVVLAKAVYIIGEAIPNGDFLKRLADIFSSARFSLLSRSLTQQEGTERKLADTNGTKNGEPHEGDGSSSDKSDSEDEKDALKKEDNDGDLEGTFSWSCDGQCHPKVTWSCWQEGPAYHCLTCDYLLCKPCYEARQADNRGEKAIEGRQFCEKDHRYLESPMPGWKGVRDGKITIDGEEPQDFGELLGKLKSEILQGAWDVFWEG